MKKMKTYIQRIILMGLFFGLASIGFASGQVFAEEGTTEIKEVIASHTYLMKDGSVWALQYSDKPIYVKGNIETIIGDNSRGKGLTTDGKIVVWSSGKLEVVEGDSGGIKQITEEFWLKSDGTVWSYNGQEKKLSNIELIAHERGSRLIALSQSGELLYSVPFKSNTYKRFGVISDVSSVKEMITTGESVALLYESGKVAFYYFIDKFNNEKQGDIPPEIVTEDAVDIAYVGPRMMVVRNDGTVWITGKERENRYTLTEQVPGISNIAKISGVGSVDGFYAMRNDGTWVKYDEGDITTIQAPTLTEIKATVSNLKPNVGDKLKISIQEIYSNGAVVKVPANEATIEAQKPHLLQQQPDGTIKVAGVGETKITVTSGGKSNSFVISASLSNKLKYSKQIKGVTYVPAKSVFQSLGGTVTAVNGGLEAKLGDKVVWFKAGSTQATLDGSSIQLKAAPIVEKGETLIPAALLTRFANLNIKWDSKWKQVELSDGNATMTIVSAETAGLVKKATQGDLAKFIGRTYWNNGYLDIDRFSKVTVTDIIPDGTGDFIIAFKTGNGTTVKTRALSSYDVSDILSYDGETFYNYDPYKRYNWSASIWKQIKAGEVSLGMTKEQVQLSWGSPSSTSVMKENGKTIETWVYFNFDTVGFINGKVVLIWS